MFLSLTPGPFPSPSAERGRGVPQGWGEVTNLSRKPLKEHPEFSSSKIDVPKEKNAQRKGNEFSDAALFIALFIGPNYNPGDK
jgi:hypothetical protein